VGVEERKNDQVGRSSVTRKSEFYTSSSVRRNGSARCLEWSMGFRGPALGYINAR
jgi:hypothetical protein